MAAWCRLGSVAPLLPDATGYLPPATPHHNQEPKCCYRVHSLFGQTPRAVTKSRCDFQETFPLPTRVPRARLDRGAELSAAAQRVGFEGLPSQPESLQNDGQYLDRLKNTVLAARRATDSTASRLPCREKITFPAVRVLACELPPRLVNSRPKCAARTPDCGPARDDARIPRVSCVSSHRQPC